jgi:diguanylate cyclase (GGDEF)-like protein/PAS domain S-box-containing protein
MHEPVAARATSDPTWRWYLGLGAVVIAVCLLPVAAAVQPAITFLIGLSVLVAVGLGVRRSRPRTPRPWILLGVGQFAFAIGEAAHVVQDERYGEHVLLSGLTNVTWLIGYALNIAGLFLLLRAKRDGRDRLGSVDAAIVATSSALLSWTYVLAPVAADPLVTHGARFLSLLYAVLDLVLLAVTLRLAVRSGGTAQRLLLASMGVLFVADVLSAQAVFGGRLLHLAVHPAWLVALALVGAAAVHPSMARLTEPHPAADGVPSRRRMWLLAGSSVLAPVLLLVEWARDEPLHVPVLAGGAGLLFLLVLTRVSLMTREMEALSARLAAQHGEQRFRSLVQNAADVILVLDRFGTIEYETPSVERVLGYAPGELLGRPFADLLDPEDAELLDLRRGGAGAGRLRLADGAWADVEVTVNDLGADPAVRGLVLTVRDVRERRALEQRLCHQANHDSLTGLPNRQLFERRLAQALEVGDRTGTDTSVLYLDLDDFKTVNDSLGHHVGDAMLQMAAERLQHAVRSTDTLSRLGGDEFAVVLPGVARTEALGAAQRLVTALADPLNLGGRIVRTTASIGVASRAAGMTEMTGRELLAAADTAMYEAKRAGRNRLAVFEDEMQRRLLRRLALEQQLRTAVQDGHVTLAYQPVVDLRTPHTVGFEALLRWTSPTYGPVSPAEFVPLAEDTGLIVPLGRHVLRTACAFVAARNAERPDQQPLRIAVNVSVRQLQEPDLLGDVQAALAAAGLPPHLLTLEITESIRLFEGSAQVLRRLQTIGVRLSLDDFGTGYAALSHLNELPIDETKIDRSFVGALAECGREAHLTTAILDLARSLDLAVVAEGVETAQQAELLRHLGAELAQGYLFSRPLDGADVPALLDRERHHAG